MTVVADSTPLIVLSKIGKLWLLEALYGRIKIPQIVFDEVVGAGGDRPGATEVASASWIEVVAIPDSIGVTISSDLDEGEASAISLALQTPDSLLVLDEEAGRREAARLGLKIIGTVGIILQAKERDCIHAVKPELTLLRAYGFHLSETIYRKALALAGE